MFKIPDSIGSPFQNFYFIVEAFRWTICDVGIFKCIQYFAAPMSVGGSTLFKFLKLRLFGCGNPFKELFSLFGILWILTDTVKPFLQVVGKPQIIVV